MKQILPLILAIVLLASACSDQRYVAMLDHAEPLIETAPDTALALLDSIDSRRLYRGNKARYALLRSQALDKNFIDVTNDSLINIAVDYYTHSRHHHYKMLSHYYHGRILYNARDYARSIVALLKAEKVAIELDDNYRLGLIYHNISNIYDNIYWGEGAIEYAQKSYDTYSLTQYHRHRDYSLLNLGIKYYNYYSYDKSDSIMNKVLSIATEQNNTIMKVEALTMLASICWAKDDFEKAIKYYNEAFSIGNTTINATHYTRMSYSYSMVGQLDDAYKYALLAQQMDSTQVEAYYIYYEKCGNDKDALQTLKKIVSQQNNILDDITTQDILKSVEEYQFMEYSLERKIKKQQLISIFCISAFVIIFVIIMSYMHIKRSRLEVERNILIAQNLQQMLSTQNTEIECLQVDLNNLFAHQFRTLDEMCRIYYESNSKKSYDKILKVIDNISHNKDYIQEMENMANKYCNNILNKFRTSYPNLKENDYLLFLYLVVDFSPQAIAFLLQIKVNNVYSRKYKLKQKITPLTSDYQEEIFKFFD